MKAKLFRRLSAIILTMLVYISAHAENIKFPEYIHVKETPFESLPYILPSKDSDGKDLLFETLSNL